MSKESSGTVPTSDIKNSPPIRLIKHVTIDEFVDNKDANMKIKIHDSEDNNLLVVKPEKPTILNGQQMSLKELATVLNCNSRNIVRNPTIGRTSQSLLNKHDDTRYYVK